MADPGFTRRGVPTPQVGGANLLFCPIFTENCMKMKEFGPRGGGARPWHPPLDPPMEMLLRSFFLRKKCVYVIISSNELWYCESELQHINRGGSAFTWEGPLQPLRVEMPTYYLTTFFMKTARKFGQEGETWSLHPAPRSPFSNAAFFFSG